MKISLKHGWEIARLYLQDTSGKQRNISGFPRLPGCFPDKFDKFVERVISGPFPALFLRSPTYMLFLHCWEMSPDTGCMLKGLLSVWGRYPVHFWQQNTCHPPDADIPKLGFYAMGTNQHCVKLFSSLVPFSEARRFQVKQLWHGANA